MEATTVVSSTLVDKWTATVASIWIQCTSGSLYTFGIYSSALKSSQDYDQSTLNTISVFKDFGANTGLLSGLLYSSSNAGSGDCSGPWVVLLAGAVQCFAGYFLMWLSVGGVLPRPPVLIMCFYMLLAAHAQTFFNTANVVTAVHNFPNYSGTIVGIMKGFLGLSGAILIQVYRTIFNNKPTSYLLMLALVPSLNSVFLMYFVRIFRPTEGDEKSHLNGFSSISLIVAAYLMGVIVLDNAVTCPFSVHVLTLVVLILLLASPLWIVIKAQIEGNHMMHEPCQLNRDAMHIGQHPIGYYRIAGGADQETDTNNVDIRIENLNLLQAICTSSFWFLFLATACGMGSGLATVNNISQIGGSLGYTFFETSTLVSLWSIWNYLGRFGAGYVSDYFLHRRGWARPLFMAITLGAMTLGHLVIASGLPGALFVGSILVGICYGSQWSLMPTIVSEIFGLVHLGTIFNAITVAGPVGSYVLSVRVVGYIYDKETSAEGKTCTGSHCFMLSFLIMACATLLGFLVALGLFFRTRRFYEQVVLRRLRLSFANGLNRVIVDVEE